MLEEPDRTDARSRMLTGTATSPASQRCLSRHGRGRDRALDLALVYLTLGDEVARGRSSRRRSVEASAPDHALVVAEGAVALELLGRTDEALRSADRAVQLTPERRDAVNGPTSRHAARLGPDPLGCGPTRATASSTGCSAALPAAALGGCHAHSGCCCATTRACSRSCAASSRNRGHSPRRGHSPGRRASPQACSANAPSSPRPRPRG